MTKPTLKKVDGYMIANGQLLTLCVLHELSPEPVTAQAMTVLGGLAVCEDHMHKMADRLLGAYTIESIIELAKDGIL